MQDSDKPQFWDLLAKEMARHGKPMPEKLISLEWWDLMQPFPLPVIAAAFQQYRRLESRFAPAPAAIENLCLQCDGRPGGDEAWATSLRATDEANSVVWTDEMQAAFWGAHPILLAKDAIGARKSFLQAYDRLVADARAARIPIKWTITPGRNQEMYALEYKRGLDLGRLPAPAKDSGLLLPGPQQQQIGFDGEVTDGTRIGLAMVKEAISKMLTPAEKMQRYRERMSQIERDHTAALKRAAAAKAEAYGITVAELPATELPTGPISSEHRTGPYQKSTIAKPKKSTGGEK